MAAPQQQQQANPLAARVRTLEDEVSSKDFTIRITKNHVGNLQDVLEATKKELAASQARVKALEEQAQVKDALLELKEARLQEKEALLQEAEGGLEAAYDWYIDAKNKQQTYFLAGLNGNYE